MSEQPKTIRRKFVNAMRGWKQSAGTRLSGLLVLLILIMPAACSNGAAPSSTADAPSVTLAELPQTTGRGYGIAIIDGLDQTGGSLQPGAPAPNFGLQLDDGRVLTLADLRGRPVLLNFWASWCGPCRMEMPDIVNVANGNGDLVVLAINAHEGMDVIEPFAQEFNMTMPIVRDTKGEVMDAYAVRGLPASVFIRPDGTIYTIWSGLINENTLRQSLAVINEE